MKPLLRFLLALTLAAGAYLAGRWSAPDTSAPEGRRAAARATLYYACPMHPAYKSGKQGNCPACGMRLGPVYADSASAAGGKHFPAGTVRISADKQQLIGVRYATAGMADGTETVRAVGRIAYDDREAVVLADLLQHEAARVQVGQLGFVSVPLHPGHSFWAKVDYVYPRLDQATRTLKVRMHAPETGFKLLVDTFVDVDFRIPGPRALTVPAEAVLNSGQRRSVFMDMGDGYLAPRQVETGRRLGDRIEILHGLRPGDRVVASANFLVDSESQLKLVAEGVRAPAEKAEFDPVCGMEVQPVKAAGKSEYRNRTYYFCSRMCKEKFQKSPTAYVEIRKAPLMSAAMTLPAEMWITPAMEQPGTPPVPNQTIVLPDESAGDGSTVPAAAPDRLPSERGTAVRKDPVCGMQVSEKNAYRRTVLYRGVTFYFCSEDCYEEYMKNPEVYGQRALPPMILQKPREYKSFQPAARMGTGK